METLIWPKIFDSSVRGFFTGKKPGVDLHRISEIASVSRKDIYLPIQKHTEKVLHLNSFEPETADSVITGRKGVLIGVQAADCIPILIYDVRTPAVGAVHAGWRGTASGILKNTLEAMRRRFSSSPSDMVIAIGPGIGGCCYSVGHEVIEAVKRATGSDGYFSFRSGKYFLDLHLANRYQAISMGVPPRNIWMSGECTFCLNEKYYSYRFAKGPTGRQGGFIGIV